MTAAAPSPRPRAESAVWLSAAGLAVGLFMIAGLLLLVAVKGLAVFWPRDVWRVSVRTDDGGTEQFAGSLVRVAERRGPDRSGAVEHHYFTGNKEVYRLAFRRIEAARILERVPAHGYWVARRTEHGDAIFRPEVLHLGDDRRMAAGEAAFEAVLRQELAAGHARRAAILDLEKRRIPALAERLQAGGDEQRQFEALAAEARLLRAAQQVARLEVRLASGEARAYRLADLLRLHPAVGLDAWGRLSVFAAGLTEFLSAEPREANTEGGVFPALFGTFVMTLLMAVLVTPFGVLAAVYLREYARQGLAVRTVRICVNNLAGVPSIVFGVFGLGFFVYGAGGFIDGGARQPLPPAAWSLCALGALAAVGTASWLAVANGSPVPGQARRAAGRRRLEGALWIAGVLLLFLALARCPYFSGFFRERLPAPTYGTGGLLWASLTLALMTLPVVIVATEEALAAVPQGIREAALAAGASRWQMIRHVVLPGALPGMMTGVILAMARGAGEVAPLMITGVVKLAPALPVDGAWPFLHPERKFMHLGFHIYDLGFQSPDAEAAIPMVFATTLLLLLLVLLLNLAAIRVRARLRRSHQAGLF
jgi:ABC-type phosphate transport system permease subunit/ABC-type phosphate transport system auxiliary subunit